MLRLINTETLVPDRILVPVACILLEEVLVIVSVLIYGLPDAPHLDREARSKTIVITPPFEGVVVVVYIVKFVGQHIPTQNPPVLDRQLCILLWDTGYTPDAATKGLVCARETARVAKKRKIRRFILG